jgi:hypothetical protein
MIVEGMIGNKMVYVNIVDSFINFDESFVDD